MSGRRFVERLPPWMGSIRVRLTVLYSVVLFGLAALVVLGIYTGVSRSLDSQAVSQSPDIKETFTTPNGQLLVGDVVTPECLPEYLQGRFATDAAQAAQGGLNVAAFVQALLRNRTPDVYRRVAQQVDRTVLEEVLRHVKGSQVQAAELLGISRTTLRAKMQALGMGLEKQVLPGVVPPE